MLKTSSGNKLFWYEWSEPISMNTNTATTDELLAYLYTKAFDCPVCDKEFVDFIVRKSKLRVLRIETDFKTHYHTIDPNHYEVLLCPNCGYASLQPYFDRITDRQQGLIQQNITPKYRPMEYPVPYSLEHVMLRYNQALECAYAISGKASQKAFLYLKMSWICRDIKDKANEIRLLRDAFIGLKDAFTTENFPIGNMDEATAKYLIADLGRRLGEFSEAMRWVSDVVVAKGIPSALKERALTLKDLIRDGKVD
jgi:uncharacterized protein (DUF2225 family)